MIRILIILAVCISSCLSERLCHEVADDKSNKCNEKHFLLKLKPISSSESFAEVCCSKVNFKNPEVIKVTKCAYIMARMSFDANVVRNFFPLGVRDFLKRSAMYASRALTYGGSAGPALAAAVSPTLMAKNFIKANKAKFDLKKECEARFEDAHYGTLCVDSVKAFQQRHVELPSHTWHAFDSCAYAFHFKPSSKPGKGFGHDHPEVGALVHGASLGVTSTEDMIQLVLLADERITDAQKWSEELKQLRAKQEQKIVEGIQRDGANFNDAILWNNIARICKAKLDTMQHALQNADWLKADEEFTVKNAIHWTNDPCEIIDMVGSRLLVNAAQAHEGSVISSLKRNAVRVLADVIYCVASVLWVNEHGLRHGELRKIFYNMITKSGTGDKLPSCKGEVCQGMHESLGVLTNVLTNLRSLKAGGTNQWFLGNVHKWGLLGKTNSVQAWVRMVVEKTMAPYGDERRETRFMQLRNNHDKGGKKKPAASASAGADADKKKKPAASASAGASADKKKKPTTTQKKTQTTTDLPETIFEKRSPDLCRAIDVYIANSYNYLSQKQTEKVTEYEKYNKNMRLVGYGGVTTVAASLASGFGGKLIGVATSNALSLLVDLSVKSVLHSRHKAIHARKVRLAYLQGIRASLRDMPEGVSVSTYASSIGDQNFKQGLNCAYAIQRIISMVANTIRAKDEFSEMEELFFVFAGEEAKKFGLDETAIAPKRKDIFDDALMKAAKLDQTQKLIGVDAKKMGPFITLT